MNKTSFLLGMMLPLIVGAGTGLTTRAQEVKDPKLVSPTEPEDLAPSSGRYDRVDQLAHLLKLTPEQKAKVRPFVDEETKKMQDLRGQKLSREERRDKFAALREETYQKVKPLLTPAQVAHWDQVRSFKPTLPKTGATTTNKVPVIPPPDEPPAKK